MKYHQGNVVRVVDINSVYKEQIGVILIIDENKWTTLAANVLIYTPYMVLVKDPVFKTMEEVWMSERQLEEAARIIPGWNKITWEECIWKPKERT